jgi:hypothetical protein
MTSQGWTVVVVDGGSEADVVVVTTREVVVEEANVPRVVLVDDGVVAGVVAPWVIRAVMPTAAAATIRTIRTIIQPLMVGRLSEPRFSSFMHPS